MRKTKIVCTLGLVSQSREVIEQLVVAGMNVARFNFSHGNHESHKKTFDTLKAVREEKNLSIAALLDTKGPEVRLGEFENGKVYLEAGTAFTLTTDTIIGTVEKASVSFANLPKDVSRGTHILLDDGLIDLLVQEINGNEIVCKVLNGGPISNRKGVNVPGVTLSMPYLSEQDSKDIAFGIETGFDYIAASFVRTAQDVLDIREVLHKHGAEDMLIISKIENAQGVENIDDILRVSDGIMIARGDMGVEIDFELLPGLQKMLIKKAYNMGKMVITATQMLESMINNPRPTRAETTDVANAIYDGTSAIMLSGETAAGKYPVKAVEVMARIAESTESDINYRHRFETSVYSREKDNITNAISHATCTTAFDLGATSIITVSLSGRATRNISKYRPDIPIIGCTPSASTYRKLALTWGVVPVLLDEVDDLDMLFDNAVKSAQELGVVNSGDIVVISTGVPLKMSGTTNLLKVHIAGDVLVKGTGLGSVPAYGRLCVAESVEDAMQKFQEKDILVISQTTNELLPILKKASGIVTENDGLNSHAAIVGSALEIPVIIGAANATRILKSGSIVTIDPDLGFVRSSANHMEN